MKKIKSGVYFAGNLETKQVKIGFSQNIESRMNTLNTSSPIKISLLGYIEGATFEDEAFLQNKFASNHLRLEWFHLSHEIYIFILESTDVTIIKKKVFTKNLTKNKREWHLIFSSDAELKEGLMHKEIVRRIKMVFNVSSRTARTWIKQDLRECSIGKSSDGRVRIYSI